MTKRLEYIDIVKGFGIILVVFFHFPSLSALPYFNFWGGYVTTFYMPLFFIMSGLFFKPQNIRHKMKRLMFPYVFFYVVAYAVYTVKCMAKHEAVDWLNFFVPFCGGTINYQNTPIWFLLALAEIMVIAFLICRQFGKHKGMAIGCVLGFVGYWIGTKDVHVPYYLDVALVNTPLFLAAFYYKEHITNLSWNSGIALIVISLFAFLVCPGFTNVSQNYIPMGYFLFYTISTLASMGLIGIARLNIGYAGRFLIFFGKNSLTVMCTHMMLMMIPTFFINHMQNTILALALGLCIVMLVEIPIVLTMNRYFKFALGK